jgi:class 3 adenylate cyclase
LILYAPLVSFVSQGDFTAGFEQAVWEQWLPAMVDTWGTGTMSALGLPSRMHEEFARDLACRFERMALSRGAFRDLMRANGLIDIRPVLPLIRVPTLVLHRLDDQLLSADHGRYMAAHITGARFIGLEGIDHYVGAGDTDAVARQVRQFLTGVTEEEPFPADRVLATVMFTDIVKSTESAVELGDRRWKRVLDDHDQLVATEVARARGRLVKTTGDGALATFDGPARALRCAQSIASNVRRLGLQVRAGVHSGEVELRGEDVGGIGVHIGARVAAAAEPGQVLASRTVVDLVVGSGIQFTDRGDFELKGVPGHWRLYAAID